MEIVTNVVDVISDERLLQNLKHDFTEPAVVSEFDHFLSIGKLLRIELAILFEALVELSVAWLKRILCERLV